MFDSLGPGNRKCPACSRIKEEDPDDAPIKKARWRF